jgi:hypothetical protein
MRERDQVPTEGVLPPILDRDGIKTEDLLPLYELQEAGFAIFMHGSGITAERIHKTSDIDFAVIGDLMQTPPRLKAELLPSDEDALITNIDYVSVPLRAANGRKISLHLQNSHFRTEYPTKPYGLEYRDASYRKETSGYFLGGVSQDGDAHVFTLTCPQIPYKGNIITYTPQTGIYSVQEKTASPKSHVIPIFGFEGLISIDRKTEKPRPWENDSSREIMIFGLELNKITEDTPFGTSLKTHTQKYVHKPIERSLSLIRDFTEQDPVVPLVHGLQGRAAMQAQRDGRMRLTENFKDIFERKLRRAA